MQGRSREVGLCAVAYFKNRSRSRHTKQYGSKQVCPPGSASNSFARNARQCHSSCTTQFRKQCCARGGFSKPHKLDMLTDMFGLPITRVEGSDLPQARSGCTREAYGTQAMASRCRPTINTHALDAATMPLTRLFTLVTAQWACLAPRGSHRSDRIHALRRFDAVLKVAPASNVMMVEKITIAQRVFRIPQTPLFFGEYTGTRGGPRFSRSAGLGAMADPKVGVAHEPGALQITVRHKKQRQLFDVDETCSVGTLPVA